mgnify:CR=1 FL=1
MKKFIKIIFVTCLAIILLMLSGCVRNAYISICPSSWDYNIKIIDINDKYILNDSHPYDIIETNNGIDVVLHFDKSEGE